LGGREGTAADKIWLRITPPAYPAEIDADLFESIPQFLARLALKFRDKPAFHNLGQTVSYAELERLSSDFAAFLQGLPGMSQGDRVAIMAPNILQYPVALFGILCAGMVVVNVNPLYTPRELEHQLNDSGAKAIVIVENFASTLQKVLESTPVRHVVTTQIGDMLPAPKRWLVNFVIKRVKKMVPAFRLERAIEFRAALARGAKKARTPVQLEREDIAFLQYTGGTTGVSKGAMLSHRNLVANQLPTGVWISTAVEGAEIAIAPLPIPHLLPDLDAGIHEVGQSDRADYEPAGPARPRQRAGALEVQRDDWREHAVQRPLAYTGVREARLLPAQSGGGRRCSRTKVSGGTLSPGDRAQHHRSLWSHGGFARCQREPAGNLLEQHRPAVFFYRDIDS
jgi:hypothetical protein